MGPSHALRPFSSLVLTLGLLSGLSGGCGCSSGEPKCEGDSCATGDGGADGEVEPTGDGGGSVDADGGVDAGEVDAFVPPTCAQLAASLACPSHRECVDLSSGGACLESCVSGYDYDALTGTCTVTPTCTPGVEGSIAEACASQHRVCRPGTSGPATCGSCLPTAPPDLETGTCVPTCTDVVCEPGAEVELQGGRCVCETRPCGADAAQSLDAPPTCQPCGPAQIVCDPASHEVALYPALDANDRCVCKPAPGYYWSASQTAEPCDADGDGWITRTAWQQINSSDPTLRAIARAGCALLQVDRIELQNEYGQSRTVFLCEDGTSETSCAAVGDVPLAIPLVEPDRNDAELNLPVYRDLGNTVGRTMRARELNALTKACASPTGDFDMDGSFDFEQVQSTVPSADPSRRWSEFAYFMELHLGGYVGPGEGETYGRYVIAERSRCSAGATTADGQPADDRFPLGYAAGTPSYWTNCTRQRDVNAASGVPGFDFASYGYACEAGDCGVPPAPRTGPFDASGAPPQPHGLCNAAAPWPANGSPWMGMLHHSQFKCVRAGRDGSTYPPASFYDPEINTSGSYDFQTCGVTDSFDDGNPDVTCVSRRPVSGEVGWASVRQTSVTRQTMGCVDELDLDNVCGPTRISASTGPFIGLTQNASDFGRITSCPRYCGRFAKTEVCSATESFDDDCDGAADNVVVNDNPNLPHSCSGVPTFYVGRGSTQEIAGTVDAMGDDFFRVVFNGLPGLGYGYTIRVDLVGGTGAYVLTVEGSCGSGAACGRDLTSFTQSFNHDPGGCIGPGTCWDSNARTSALSVRVRRTGALCSGGAPVGYRVRLTNG